MKKKADEIREAIPGVKDGDPILYNGAYEALEGRVQCWGSKKLFQCYVKKDNVGQIVNVSMDKADGQEYIVALLNVIDGDRVFPAVTEVGGAKTRFVHDVVEAAKATTAKDWAAGDKVREGLTGMTPAFRVAGSLSTQEKVSRASGMKYHIVSAKATPLTFEEASALAAAIKSDSYSKAVAVALEQFDRKVAELKMML
jgi:hypothetical protein